MILSDNAQTILNILCAAGYEAFAVGGCVRDMLRGLTPSDIDITTNALPEQIVRVFEGYRVIPTGAKHGTVTVLLNGDPFEITTYRTDGTYSDGRHPDSVRFTSSLQKDLARRDFTVNAMAFHPEIGLVDPFNGQRDLNDRLLRCVGDAQTRFSEDALRIARLLRFMSVLDFDAEPQTAAAAHRAYQTLDVVAAERKRVELMKCLCGKGFLRAATQFPDILCRIVPSLQPLYGFEQHNPHHSFDIYTHTIRAVAAAKNDPIVRLAVLLHDIGKPQTFFLDEQGIGHFYGHPAVSETLAQNTLKALRFDNATINAVLPLVRHHDLPLTDDKKQIKRWLSRLGEITFWRLLEVKKADARGCHEHSTPPDFSGIYRLVEQIKAENACLTLRDLAVNGQDLLALGVSAGPRIGEILNALLEAVIEEQTANTRDELLAIIKERYLDV